MSVFCVFDGPILSRAALMFQPCFYLYSQMGFGMYRCFYTHTGKGEQWLRCTHRTNVSVQKGTYFIAVFQIIQINESYFSLVLYFAGDGGC